MGKTSSKREESEETRTSRRRGKGSHLTPFFTQCPCCSLFAGYRSHILNNSFITNNVLYSITIMSNLLGLLFPTA